MTKCIPPSWVCLAGVVLLHLWAQLLLLSHHAVTALSQLLILVLSLKEHKTLYTFLYPYWGSILLGESWISAAESLNHAQKQLKSIRRIESACRVPCAWVFLGPRKPVACIPVGNFSVNWFLSPPWKVKGRNARKMRVFSLWIWCSAVPIAKQQLPCKHWATVSILSSWACYRNTTVVFHGEVMEIPVGVKLYIKYTGLFLTVRCSVPLLCSCCCLSSIRWVQKQSFASTIAHGSNIPAGPRGGRAATCR